MILHITSVIQQFCHAETAFHHYLAISPMKLVILIVVMLESQLFFHPMNRKSYFNVQIFPYVTFQHFLNITISLLHLIWNFFSSFPFEMNHFGFDIAHDLFKLSSDVASCMFKYTVLSLISIIISLGEKSTEILTRLSPCIKNALQSRGP